MSSLKLAEVTRDRRKRLGLTQTEVARRADMSVELLRMIENNRGHRGIAADDARRRLSAPKARGLERALLWQSGSVDAVLDGGNPTVDDTAPPEPETAPPVAAGAGDANTDRFALARHVLALRDTFAAHQDVMRKTARDALAAEMARSARDAEESIIRMMPWLPDTDRGEAIDLLIELRKTLQNNASD